MIVCGGKVVSPYSMETTRLCLVIQSVNLSLSLRFEFVSMMTPHLINLISPQVDHPLFKAWLSSVIDGTYSASDIPTSFLIAEFLESRGIAPGSPEADEFHAFYSTYMAYDQARDLFAVGLGGFLGDEHGDDREVRKSATKSPCPTHCSGCH